MVDRPSDLGFAEFAAQLIGEVFEAVTTSRAEQDQRISEIKEVCSLGTGDFAARFVGDDAVESELERLFPPTSMKLRHGAQTGAPYTPEGDKRQESPPFRRRLDVSLSRDDYVVHRDRRLSASLNASGARRIREAVRERIAVARQGELVALLQEGLPRVVVDSGRVNAKLTFEVLSVEEGEQPERRERLIRPLVPLGKLHGFTPADASKALRIVVRQAEADAPQTSTIRANVFGEVEITFKTVV
jgi:hypothetical protein